MNDSGCSLPESQKLIVVSKGEPVEKSKNRIVMYQFSDEELKKLEESGLLQVVDQSELTEEELEACRMDEELMAEEAGSESVEYVDLTAEEFIRMNARKGPVY